MTSPDPVLTTLVTLSGLALSIAALALSVARRLAARVASLEARAVVVPAAPRLVPDPTPKPAPPPGTTRRVDRPGPPAISGPILISVPNLASTPAEGSTPELGRRYAAIWEMADAGKPAETIARATGQPIGQVELILGLKRRKPATGGPRLP